MADIQELYQKFLDRRCSREEAEALLHYFSVQPDSGEILAMIQSELDRPQDASNTPEELAIIGRNREQLRKRILGRPQRRINPTRWALVAASVVVFLGLVFYVFLYQPTADTKLISIYGDDVLPGGNRAYITLSDGQRLELDSTKSGISVADGNLSYTDGEALLSGAKAEYATISTPKGGEYQLVLPDGSRAWLNAGSELKYPLRFAANERRIEAQGEVYLEVARDQEKPFRVQTGDQLVEVLGTAFNINRYGEATEVVTTLIEGKIALADRSSGQMITLTPGQQSRLGNGKIQVQDVNVQDFIAWKNGYFMGRGITLREISQQLERWYDVAFHFPDSYNNNERALISIERNEKLSSVLAALENTYRVTFKIAGKEVLVE